MPETTFDKGEAIVAAVFDLDSGLALVSEDDIDWLAECSDIVANKDSAWEISIAGKAHGFEVVPVSASVVARTTPKVGTRRRWRHARCGGGEPAKEIPCFKLNSGRYANVELAGYSQCVRGDDDERCEEEYVKIGDITIYWDRDCRLVAQVHPQHRWVCLP